MNNSILSYEELFNKIKKEKENIGNQVFDYLYSLVHLEASVFDSFASVYFIGNELYQEIIKYNIWYKTFDKLKELDNESVLQKDSNGNGIILLNDVVIGSLYFNSPIFGTSIHINCYEDDEYNKKLINLNAKRDELIMLYKNYIENKGDRIPKNHDEAIRFSENIRKTLQNIRDIDYQIKRLEECISLYEDKRYRQCAYNLLDEYKMPNVVGKTYLKKYNFGKVLRSSK